MKRGRRQPRLVAGTASTARSPTSCQRATRRLLSISATAAGEIGISRDVDLAERCRWRSFTQPRPSRPEPASPLPRTSRLAAEHTPLLILVERSRVLGPLVCDDPFASRLAAEYIRSHADDFLPFLLAAHDLSGGLPSRPAKSSSAGGVRVECRSTTSKTGASSLLLLYYDSHCIYTSRSTSSRTGSSSRTARRCGGGGEAPSGSRRAAH